MLTGLEMVCHCWRGPGYANRSETKQKENWQGNQMETRLRVVFSHLCLKAYRGILAPIRCSAECVLTAWIAEAEVLGQVLILLRCERHRQREQFAIH